MHAGDTIVELMLAFGVFSLAAVSTIMIMNKGIAVSQQSLESSQVRAQIDGQAEVIRYLRDTSDPLWDALTDPSSGYVVTDSNAIASLAPTACFSSKDISDRRGFFLTNSDSGLKIASNQSDFKAPSTYAKIEGGAAYGVWAQITKAENKSGTAITAYDVYIHACWDSLATGSVPATLGTIVRIYDK